MKCCILKEALDFFEGKYKIIEAKDFFSLFLFDKGGK